MKTVVDWLLAQRYRPIIFAVAFAPLFPMVTTALMVLEAAFRGPSSALIGAVIGIVAMLVLALVTGGSLELLVGIGAAAMLAGVAIGALLHWAGALSLAFQGTVLGSFALVMAIVLLGPSPDVLFAPVVEQLVEVLASGGAPPEQLENVRGWGALLLGLLSAAVFAQLVASLLLGYWWLTLAREEIGFGVEFRALKLGRVLGIPAMVLVALGLVWNVALVQNLTPLAMFGFLFQGLAVMHAWAHVKRWHPGLLVPVYVLLVTPLTGIAILGLSAVGLLDNIFDLRAPLRARTL